MLHHSPWDHFSIKNILLGNTNSKPDQTCDEPERETKNLIISVKDQIIKTNMCIQVTREITMNCKGKNV